MNALPQVTQRLLAQVRSSPRRSVTSYLAAMLGRTELPGRLDFAGLRPATRVLIAGLSAWIGLVGLLTVTAIASVEMSTMSFPAWFGARSPATPSTELRSPAGFENILQRPLFSRSRQGAAPAPAPVSAPPVLVTTLDQGIILKGVFISGDLAKAFLISAQNPLGVWVQANEEISGWRVVAVKPDQVLLDGQNEKLVVQLSVNGGAK